MKVLRYLLVLQMLVGAVVARAQTRVDPLPNSLSPNYTKSFYSPRQVKSVKRKKPNVKHTAKFEFYKRVERAAKDRQRALKRLSKPQFANPEYFGHKRKPKRRASHKMRFCKECHIRH
ncbi:MAG: hypothetical protein RLN86_07570 [Cyclobacteriaceae bacterium]